MAEMSERQRRALEAWERENPEPSEPRRDIPPAAATPESPVSGQMIGWGYVLAVFLPLVGFIIGIVALSKGEKHGIGMMVVAAVVFGTVVGVNY